MNNPKRTISPIFPAVNTFLRGLRDIHHDDMLLEKCYVNVWARDFDANAVASYACNIPALAFKSKNEQFRQRAIETLEVFSEQLCLDPIFLYAHIGHGKTTYVRYLQKIRMKSDPTLLAMAGRVYIFYLEYTLSDPAGTFIRNDFAEKLDIQVHDILAQHKIDLNYATLSEMFPAQLRQYERLHRHDARSPDGFHGFIANEFSDNKLLYLRHIVDWLLHKRKIKICCILDNVDRHISQFNSEPSVIALVQEVKSCFLQLILPLRIANRGLQYNEYFRMFGPIPITLGLPDYGAIIKKRLAHIKTYLTEQLRSSHFFETPDQPFLTSDEIIDGLSGVAVLISGNDQVRHGMEMISNYITREYLDIMMNLFSSEPLYRHPLTGKTINYSERVKHGKFHSLFIYALMLRNNGELKEDDRSIPILHLFNDPAQGPWSRFVRWYILYHLSEISEDAIAVGQLQEDLELRYGIPSKVSMSALSALCLRLCIGFDTPNHYEPEKTDDALKNTDTTLQLSPRGQYHLELSKELEYYEVLAIPRLLLTKRDFRDVPKTSMSERQQNLRDYLYYRKIRLGNL